MTYGGIVTHFIVPDKTGRMGDVVLGHDSFAGYVESNLYFGAVIGRYSNRIAGGTFTLDQETYFLTVNNGPNSAHGGLKGFDKVVWEAIRAEVGPDGPRLELHYLSPDGEEGFPGNLDVTAVYTFSHDNALRLDFQAVTDKPTVVNLTQHSYFNLRGHGDVNDHVVQIHGSRIATLDSTLIPTGELMPVDGTPFDFRRPTAIGARLDEENDQLKYANGYDHSWGLDKSAGVLEVIARITEPESGRVLEVSSTEPATQFYGGNFLDGTITGKGGWTYGFRHGFCVEPQHYPNSPNQPDFPSTVLRPGDTYKNTIIYKLAQEHPSPVP